MSRRARLAAEFAAPTVVSVALMVATAPYRPARVIVADTWVEGVLTSAWALGLAMAVIGLPSLLVGVGLALLEIRQSGSRSAHAPVLFGTLAASTAAIGYLFWMSRG
ncbi:MAG: hypothetical protein AB1635_14910 [Acidobacteriota bacterium]